MSDKVFQRSGISKYNIYNIKKGYNSGMTGRTFNKRTSLYYTSLYTVGYL